MNTLVYLQHASRLQVQAHDSVCHFAQPKCSCWEWAWIVTGLAWIWGGLEAASRLLPCKHFFTSKGLCLESETWGLKNPETLSFSLPVLQMPPLICSRRMHYLCCNLARILLPYLYSVPGALLFMNPTPLLLRSQESKQAVVTCQWYKSLSSPKASSEGRDMRHELIPEQQPRGWMCLLISSASEG